MPFWEYAIFYIIMILSGAFVIFILMGVRLDNFDYMSRIAEDLEGIPKNMPEMIELRN